MPNRVSRIALLAVMFMSLFSATVPALAQSTPAMDAAILQELQLAVPNFGIVSPVLLRGGQPKLDHLWSLKHAGVKTIVCLRDGQQDIEIEREAAAKAGLKFVSIPMSVLRSVSKDKVDKFLSVVRDPENQPVFVHCRQGQDRCGTMVAMYRLNEQSWTADRAYDEMLKYGFHPIFLGLSSAVYATGNMLHPSTPTSSDVGTVKAPWNAQSRRSDG